jgi:hypothetical protein
MFFLLRRRWAHICAVITLLFTALYKVHTYAGERSQPLLMQRPYRFDPQYFSPGCAIQLHGR